MNGRELTTSATYRFEEKVYGIYLFGLKMITMEGDYRVIMDIMYMV